jgi:BirA family transcriptional regulator, biotin operon repressor / biotin---[acetyl-CoA-carboxylase] ligase
MDLDPAAVAGGARLLALDTVGSTNAEALARARSGESGPLWITAACQTAGRGRRGRGFVSEQGNLFASLLLTDPSPPEHAAELSFVAAVALHDAVADGASCLAGRLTVKWPNDLLCDGAKLAGILVEGERAPGRPLATVVGIGVNVAHHPGGTEYPATDLAFAGAPIALESLFAALTRSMARRLSQWNRGDGFAAIRAAWLTRAHGIGTRIRVNLPDRQLEGRFETVDAAGHLILQHSNGSVEAIAVGDVFPLETVRLREQV